jgi:hypothetical protein
MNWSAALEHLACDGSVKAGQGPLSARMVLWRRGAGWVALLGLLMQIALTLTHVHPIAVRSDIDAASAAADFGGGPSPQNGPSAPDSDHCSVCLAQHLAGHGMLPVLAVIAVPEVFDCVYLGRDSEIGLSRPDHLLFQTRAPPVA